MTVSGNLTNEEIDELFNSQYIARLGCCEDGKPYIVPITFAFDSVSKDVIGVSDEGMKMEMVRNNPHVCVEVEQIQDIANWKSVIAWGDLEELSGADARNALHHFVRTVTALVNNENSVQVKFLRDISYSSPETPADFVVYRIRIKERSGKFEKMKEEEKSFK